MVIKLYAFLKLHGVLMLKPEDVTVIVDTREQLPYDLSPLKMVRAKLDTGDYSVQGLEHRVTIERKSFEDYVGVVGKGRERFEREIERMKAYDVAMIIVEAHWGDLECGFHRSRVSANSLMGSTLGWMAEGPKILFCGNRRSAELATGRLLWILANREYKRQLKEREDVTSGSVGQGLQQEGRLRQG